MGDSIRCGGLDLDRSLVFLEGGALVGIALLGVRGAHGWVGGFGVAPDFRGRGSSQILFSDFVARFPRWGLTQVDLEVLVQNWAFKVYERAGFVVTRRLSVLAGTLPLSGSQGDVHEAEPHSLLAHAERLHGDAPACWQRGRPYLAASLPASASGLRIGPADAPAGVLLAVPGDSAVRIVDAVAIDDGAAQALIEALGARYPGRSVRLVNEPPGTTIHRALCAAGCVEEMAQHEMRWLRPA